MRAFAMQQNDEVRGSEGVRGGGGVQGVLVNMSAEMHRPESRPRLQLVELFSASRPGTAFRISLYDLSNSFNALLFQSYFVILSHAERHVRNKFGSKGINIRYTWFLKKYFFYSVICISSIFLYD